MQPVESSLEVVKDQRVGQTFEDESELPKGVQAIGQPAASNDMRHGKYVDDDKDNRQYHGQYEDCKSGKLAEDLEHAEFVPLFDVVEQNNRREDPPRIAEKGFVWPGVDEEVAVRTDLVEEEKVCGNLEYPVRLCEGDSDDVYQANTPAEERFDLDPGDDVVQRPAGVEEYGSNAYIPAIVGSVREDEGALEHAEDELSSQCSIYQPGTTDIPQ